MSFLFRKKKPLPKVCAVVAAAGSSRRMEGIDKQQAAIEEIPVVVRSLETLCACPLLHQIVLVCPRDQIPDYYALVREYGLDLVSSVVGGGESRQDSVFAGIESCDEDAAYFAIHDGARPLVTTGEVEECIRTAMEDGCAALGVPVKDTVKQTDAQGFITVTPAREGLVAIQTPQVFEAGLYREAMALAKRENRSYTDDCQLVERTGKKVRVVPGSYGNMKITTPEDLAIAAAVLRFREEGPELWQPFE